MAIIAGGLTTACADRYNLGSVVTGGANGGGGGTTGPVPDAAPPEIVDVDAEPPGPDGFSPPTDAPSPGDLAPPGVCTKETACRLAIDLDKSGTSNLPDELTIGMTTLAPAFRYRGEAATAAMWPGAPGPALARGTGVPVLALDAPFTDATRAVGLGGTGAAYAAAAPDVGTLANDDFVLELVLRAAPNATVASKGAGWVVTTLGNGALALDLNDGARTVRAGTSEALSARAWYHCLFWVSRSSGARIDCNGRSGMIADPAAIAGLGSLGTAGTLAIGGTSPAAGDDVQLALVQLYRAAAGVLGPPASWSQVSRRRFFEMTGVFPQFAAGSAMPAENLRNSVAYLDMQRMAGGPRRIFLVGPDWPRISCRTDARSARVCGYLAEPGRTRQIETNASSWAANEVTVAPSNVVFIDGEQRMEAVTATVANARHTLVRPSGVGTVRNAFSFFVRAGSSTKVGASVGLRGMAVYDLSAGTAVPPDGIIAATIEPWGDGIFRCGYIYEDIGGQPEHRVHLLNNAGAEIFAGDANPVIHVAGFQLDENMAFPTSLLAANSQSSDKLTFVGNDGNWPSAGPVMLALQVNLPPWPRYLDEAVVNINKGGDTANQINLFIVGYSVQQGAGAYQFTGISQSATHWVVRHPARTTDGVAHSLIVEWGGGMARLSIDGRPVGNQERNVSAALYTFDRIDVGFSPQSSTYLKGLVGRLELKGQ
ncbi:MAG TPA: hypothetical protein VGF45_11655 [Polyangia bacterium]